jgi:signal transduction histidine kinase
VGNAIKFTGQGGVTLGARIDSDEGSHLVLRFEVRDTGIGIAPEAVGKIFRPSSRPTARPPAPTAAPAWGWRSPSGWPS